MRSSSSPGFDLRGAVDGLRQALASPSTTAASPDAGEGRNIRAAILLELSVEPMHGYQILRAVEVRSGGAWGPTPGEVYPTLQALDDEGLVTAAQIGERKVYSLTEEGRVAAAAAAESAVAANADIANAGSAHAGSGSPKGPQQPRGQGLQGALALTSSAAKLAQVMALVAQTGTPRQTERAVAVVDEARRKLYAILAEE